MYYQIIKSIVCVIFLIAFVYMYKITMEKKDLEFLEINFWKIHILIKFKSKDTIDNT